MGVDNRFAGRRCIVAGKGRIVDAVAERLRGEGAAVYLPAAELVAETSVRQEVDAAVAQLGGVDVLVTAFSERGQASFLEIDDEAWERCLAANLTGPFLVARECARVMTAAGSGVIVLVGSDVAARPGPGDAAYAAAMAGVHLLATVMGLDLAPHGVRVCAVAAAESPASVAGPSDPPGPDAVAGAVAFCASDAASYVLGSTFFIDGPVPVRS